MRISVVVVVVVQLKGAFGWQREKRKLKFEFVCSK